MFSDVMYKSSVPMSRMDLGDEDLMYDGGMVMMESSNTPVTAEIPSQNPKTRTYFPETWLWQLIHTSVTLFVHCAT